MHTDEHVFIVPLSNNKLDNDATLNSIYSQFLSKYDNSPDIEKGYTDTLDSELRQFGGEFLGMYVSMHSSYQDEKIPWGIYLFPEVIKACADRLFNNPSLPRKSQSTYRKLLLLSVFRHELFHFQVERFTTILEITSKRALYLPYTKTVYCH